MMDRAFNWLPRIGSSRGDTAHRTAILLPLNGLSPVTLNVSVHGSIESRSLRQHWSAVQWSLLAAPQVFALWVNAPRIDQQLAARVLNSHGFGVRLGVNDPVMMTYIALRAAAWE
jgi:hypothetical protein